MELSRECESSALSEVRAAALAALLTGQSVSQVAKAYKLPKGTVSAWKKRNVASIAAGVAAHATQKRREDVGSLLVDYLHTSLITLRQQGEAFGDRDWLLKQDAGELAVLHGVMMDKTIRLLEAMGETDRP